MEVFGIKIKKLVSGLIAAVIAVTATLAVATSASAADTYYLDNYDVVSIKNGVGFTFKNSSDPNDEQHWGKLTLGSTTVVTVSAKDTYWADCYSVTFYSMSDSTTTDSQVAKITYKEIAKGGSVKLTNGTYAVLFNNGSLPKDANNNTYTFKWKDTAKTDTSAASLKVYIPMETGDKLSLSTVATPSGTKITYKSSDSNVITVTSNGTVKAVDVGKAYITVKAGKKSTKLYFKVTG